MEQGLKDAFMDCDRLIMEMEAIKEMKSYDEDVIDEDE